MARAFTKEEVQEKFLEHVRGLVKYWEKTKGRNSEEKLKGLAFSMLVLFDGASVGFPAIDLAVKPHSDDKAYHIKKEENYFERGMVFNADVSLHDDFYR